MSPPSELRRRLAETWIGCVPALTMLHTSWLGPVLVTGAVTSSPACAARLMATANAAAGIILRNEYMPFLLFGLGGGALAGARRFVCRSLHGRSIRSHNVRSGQ